ncbi:MAG: ATP-NAD kinase family protein [Candidatus Thermoplasmatota archaeon]
MKRIGFVINPIAGLGGRVGLKGSDGQRTQEIALSMGAVPLAGERAWEAIKEVKEGAEWLTCAGRMGLDVLSMRGFRDVRVVYEPSEQTTAHDTKAACAAFLQEDAELVVFCGGDGTARDVLSILNAQAPMLGIPGGVKMHSGVFGTSPAGTAALINRFMDRELPSREVEVLDVDEEACRKGVLAVKLFGIALCPYERGMIQGSKCVFEGEGEDIAKEEIAAYMTELMEPGTVYLFGPGSTTSAVLRGLGLKGSLLGVDAVKDRQMVGADLNEKQILGMIERERVVLVLSPIGAQGYILGRGNQQLSPAVLRRIGADGMKILATPLKLRDTPVLRVDTGDREMDAAFRGYRRVITGYHRFQVRLVE